MQTKCITIISQGSTEFCVLSRNYDGYPDVHGAALKHLLESKGIIVNRQRDFSFMQMRRIAAQIVDHFIRGPGDCYLHESFTRDLDETYQYGVFPFEGSLNLRLKKRIGENFRTLYNGSFMEFFPDLFERDRASRLPQAPVSPTTIPEPAFVQEPSYAALE
jgi:hypothetical protein